MQKDSIKREQSQAGLSFAERKNFRPQVKNKLLLLLVLLMTAATGAWAQTETLLTTITATGKGSYSETTPGVVTVTHDNDDFDGDYGWIWWENSGSVTVEAKEGYTITKCVFHQTSKSPVTVSTAPFKINFVWDDHKGKFLCEGMDGVSSIEVYGGVAATTYTVSLKDGVKDADKWTITPNPAEEGQTVTLQYNGRLKVKGVKATSDAAPAEEPAATLGTPLTMEAVTPGTIQVKISGTLSSGMKYSVNGGTKTTITSTTNIEGLKAGDKVQFYGNGTSTQVYGDSPEVSIQGSGDGFQTKVYGNIMSLLDEEGFATKTDLPNAQYVFYGLFKKNATIIDASELLLPAETLAYACYQEMFENCTSLTKAPKLPAPTLNSFCYLFMFSGCTSLTSAYVKAAYIADKSECTNMFDGCTTTGAVLHTTSYNKASWETKMGTGKTWENWTVVDDWQVDGKPAATVTTAPTGAAVVGVGKSTALVSGGAAEGGTLWYAVTTTNTKPTSTEGFSDAVPTAKDITASGKVYVWYYVKADDTHSDSEIAATAIEVPVADIVWDVTNVSDLGVSGTYASYEKEGVKLSGNVEQVNAQCFAYGYPEMDGIYFNTGESGGFTFTAPDGKKFTKIEMTLPGPSGWNEENLGTGWAYNHESNYESETDIYTVTWKGSAAASTVGLLTGADMFSGERVTSIAFYLSE